MKKVIYSLSINGYAPEITEVTFPLMQKYAHKIGADFEVIRTRKWPDLPPVYEKMQLYELSKHNDWTIYIDADTLVRPDFPDITPLLSKDTVCFHAKDFAPVRWRYNNDFLRDGRHIGACNWFTIASDWCSDLWHPLEIPFEEAVENIFPTLLETKTIITREHLIDDYLLSWNIARFGLKHAMMETLLKQQYVDSRGYLWHEYLKPVEEKLVIMDKVLKAWQLR